MAKKSKLTAKGAPDLTGKQQELSADMREDADQFLTSNQGLRIQNDQNSLKAGERGPSLLEDFILREKITHFDHERIPERVVHARGVGAHGHFQVYKSLSKHTRAQFLQDPEVKTPVFVRFSTVAGSRGSSDMARDVRGFAVKFYTEEGVFDMVGNNIPVFFIQDAVKFPDLIHAVKPEPHNEIPQAQSAHDTFWDFISLMPESMHMIMWVMSDRSIPRSLRMMEGFGVHTFRLVNDKDKAVFVKFHWKPLLGVHSILWDEALKISGQDPDFHRRDLWEAIASGAYPEWELGLQIVSEAAAESFDFDLLDPTKLIPEELVPVQRVGKLTLTRNPDNYFAETEQVAFHPGHIVPGIDFSNDPLLQGRLFSYTDTQLLRLGGPNFHQLPINRSIAPVHNNQRDGLGQHQVVKGQVSYQPNSLGGGCPFQAGTRDGGFRSYPEATIGTKVRARGPKFFDHFSQARLFFLSQSPTEQQHIVSALRFELGKVETVAIRERMLGLLLQVDKGLAKDVATGLGLKVPAKAAEPLNHAVPGGEEPKRFQPTKLKEPSELSPALSMATTAKESAATRKVAVLAGDGFDAKGMNALVAALTAAGAMAKIVAPHQGSIEAQDKSSLNVDFSLSNCSSVLFDGVFVAGGQGSVASLGADGLAARFVMETYKHCKAVAAAGEGVGFVDKCLASVLAPAGSGTKREPGVLLGKQVDRALTDGLIEALAQHRAWEREEKGAQLPV